MRTVACPSCSEIIPDDVDYCPFCGESTRVVEESLMTDEDIAVATRMAAIKEQNVGTEQPEQTAKLPPMAGKPMCMMCHLVPPTIEDYCAECHEKLELKPEHWDNLKRQTAQRTYTFLLIAFAAVLIAFVVISHALHHRH